MALLSVIFFSAARPGAIADLITFEYARAHTRASNSG